MSQTSRKEKIPESLHRLSLELSSVPDPDPHVFRPSGSGPLVRGMDPDPDPSSIKQK